MKQASGALAIAAGIVLLWVVTSGRTANLSSAWASLLGAAPNAGSGGSTSLLPTLVPSGTSNGLGDYNVPSSTVPLTPGGGVPLPSLFGPITGQAVA